MRRFIVGLVVMVLITGAAFAQSVQQSGNVTRNHSAIWNSNGIIEDGGSASDSPLSTFGVDGQFCVMSDRLSASGRNLLCFQAAANGPATITLQNYGVAVPQPLQFVLNGATLLLPSGGGTFATIAGTAPYPIGNLLNFNTTAGVLGDSGITTASGVVTAGTWQGSPVGVAYGGTGSATASGARTNLGLGTMAVQNASAVAITGGSATGFPTPVNPTDVAIKSYVDSTATGLNILPQSTLATAAVLPNSPTYSNGASGVGATLTAGSNTTLTVDGVSAPLNTVVLVKNQASAFQNGIYTVTTAGSGGAPWVLTRATYFNTAAQMKAGSYTFITSGSTNGNSSWTLQTAVVTVGSDALTFNQFSSSSNAVLSLGGLTGVVGLGNGLTTSGSSIAANLSAGVGIGITGTNPLTITAVTPPGGRLTLVSGQPEMTADTTSQNLYYAPDTGNTCPIWNGTSWINYQFTSSATDQVGLTLALAGSANWPAGTIFDVFCVNNGGTIQLGTRAWDAAMLPSFTQISSNSLTTIQTGTSGATWSNPTNAFNGTTSQSSATAAATNAGNANLNNCLGQDMGPAVTKVLTKVTIWSPTDTSYRGDNPTTVVMNTYGSNDNINWQRLDPTRNVLSTAAVEGTSYSWNINALDATPYRYFRVCTTGNGVNANRFAQIQFFTTTPPSTRRLALFNGILTNDATITARISASSTISVPQNQATYLGSFQTDAAASGQVTANFGYGPSRVLNLWNYYNRKLVTLAAGIPATNSALPASATFNYGVTWPAWQDWQGVQSSTSYSVQVLVGYSGDTVQGAFSRAWYINAPSNAPASYEFGIGIDTTASLSGSEGGFTNDDIATGSALGHFGTARVTVPPFFGTHTLYGIEKLSYQPAGGAAVQAFENIGNTGLYVQTYY